MTTFLGSYQRARRSRPGEVTRLATLTALSEDTMTATVDLAGETFELPVQPGKYVPGALVAVLESQGKPRRVTGAAGVWPEGLDEDASPPAPVDAVEVLAPRELSTEERDLIYGSDARIASAESELGTLQGKLDSRERVMSGFGPPTGVTGPIGSQYIERDADGDVAALWEFDASKKWVQRPLSVNVGKLKAAIGVEAPEVVAQSIWAAIARFDHIITKDLVATGAIDGMDITGARFLSSSNTANSTIMDKDGVHAFVDGKEQVRLSQSISGGLAVRNPNTDTLTPLSTFVFGMQVFEKPNDFAFNVASGTTAMGPWFYDTLGTFVPQYSRYMCLWSAETYRDASAAGFFLNGALQVRVGDASSSTVKNPMEWQHMHTDMPVVSWQGIVDFTVGATHTIQGQFRGNKFSGTAGQGRVRRQSLLLIPIQ